MVELVGGGPCLDATAKIKRSQRFGAALDKKWFSRCIFTLEAIAEGGVQRITVPQPVKNEKRLHTSSAC